MNDLRVDIANTKFEVRSCGILRSSDKILISCENDSTNTITLTGGAVMANEMSEQTVVREFKEETNLQVHVDKLVAIVENFFKIDSRFYHEILFVYNVSLDQDIQQILENNENPDTCWKKANDVKNLKPTVLNEIINLGNNELKHYINRDY